MRPKVAIVEFERDGDVEGALKKALALIGGIEDLNMAERTVVVKVGVFDPKSGIHSTVSVVKAIINSFNRVPRIFVAESDNYKGKGSERLQIWKELFTERVVPFNLSEDTDNKKVKIADEEIGLSHILFKPNIFVSTHVLRAFEKGSIIKNLLGLIPDSKKARFHKKLEATLLDTYEAIDRIDLAVLDGTYLYPEGATDRKRIEADILVVGRDAVAVETVGATIAGSEPEKMQLIREAVKRGLGVGDLAKIEVVGNSIENVKERLSSATAKTKKKKKAKASAV